MALFSEWKARGGHAPSGTAAGAAGGVSRGRVSTSGYRKVITARLTSTWRFRCGGKGSLCTRCVHCLRPPVTLRERLSDVVGGRRSVRILHQVHHYPAHLGDSRRRLHHD